ncbi:uncharacterized protein [Mobula birostris]|uniref:uncharacterized protein isoform X2 n=1 Tax=Mobula birostris TaxID=1983395 RepID=UPI003B286E4C
MGHGSPLCAKIRDRIVSQFKRNISQRKIAENSGLSTSTVHNIVKSFREFRDISVRKGQGRKPLLNARDLRALRRHCLRNRPATVTIIAAWAWEYFGKPLSLNTIRRCIQKCNLKLYYARRKPYINSMQKFRRVPWARADLRWTERLWNRMLWSDESTFQLVFGKNGRRVLHAKDENDHPDCYQRKVQKPASVMVWGCISAHGMEFLCKCCQAVDCKCNCTNSQEIIATIPDPNQCIAECTVKVDLRSIFKPYRELEDLFQDFFDNNGSLYHKFKKIINGQECEILKITEGCIEFHLQLRSYMALLNLTVLHHGTVSEGIKQLAPLHQKIEDVLMEALPHEHMIPEMFSFQNIFKGGSYRSALEFFCGGFSIDDMLPIRKKQKPYQRIDYLCIDINSAPRSTLSDLKREFIKKRDRVLRNCRRKLKKDPKHQNDLKFLLKIIDGLLNKSCKNQGKSCKKSRESGKKPQSVKTTKRKKPCELEIPERKVHQLESTAEAKHPLEFDAEKLVTSYKPPLKQMKVSSYFQKEEEFKAIPSTETIKEDSVQVKSKEQSVRRKEKKSTKKVRKISAEAKPPEKNQTGSLILENAQTKNLSKEENLFPKIHSKTSKKKDATQLKSEEEGAKTKRKQRISTGEIDLAKKTQVSTPTKMEPTHIKKEADTKEHIDVPVTKKHPEKKQVVKRRQWAQKTMSAKMQVKRFEVLVLSMVKGKPWKCYGCRKQLLDGEDPDLVLKTEDFREYFSGCKQKHLAFKPSNVYFHVNEKCVENKYGPFRQHKFTVPHNVLKHLNSTQFTMLKSMNIIQGADDTKRKIKTPGHDLKHGKLMQYKLEKVEASPSSQCCQSSVSH